MRVLSLLIAALLALALAAGCGDDDDENGGSADTGTSEVEAPAPADLKDTSAKPTIPKPAGEPPTHLVKEDIVVGKGPPARPGDTITVHYVGVSHSTGEQFDASWDGGQPFTLQLGAGDVIPGWDRGLVGMRQGGRRKLVIPPDLAYGPTGQPPVIAPNETLVFVVDLLGIG